MRTRAQNARAAARPGTATRGPRSPVFAVPNLTAQRAVAWKHPQQDRGGARGRPLPASHEVSPEFLHSARGVV